MSTQPFRFQVSRRSEESPSSSRVINVVRRALARLRQYQLVEPSGTPTQHLRELATTTPLASRLRTTALTAPIDFDLVTKGALAYMDQAERANATAITQDGVGLRYGEKSPYAKLSDTERFKYVKDLVKKKDPTKANDAYVRALMARMRPTSCIGYTMEALRVGYTAAGQSDRWAEIAAATRAKGTIGTVLMAELQKDGWEAVYFNADTRTYRGPTEKPADRQRMGDHVYFNNRFMSGGTFKAGLDAQGNPVPGHDYYGTYPQHALVNFFAAPSGREPRANPAALNHLKRATLWVGVAASGYHTFPGSGVRVRDSHVSRNPDERTNLENRPFEELDLAWDSVARNYKLKDGKPVYSEEQSGIILIPPGTWTD